MPTTMVEMLQGQETDDFWELLGGCGPVGCADQGGEDDMVEGLPDAYPPIPERSKQVPRAAIIGAGVAGAICAKTIKDHFGIDVVVFESEGHVGGRLGAEERSGIPFSAGASYLTAQGPHMKKYLTELLREGAISEWKPRVGMVGKSGHTSGEYQGFIPAMNMQEEEINIEAWIEDRPKTGAPRPGGKSRPACTFWEPQNNVPLYDLAAPNPLHRRSHALGFGQGHGSGSWYISKPRMASVVEHLLTGIDVRLDSRVQAALPQLGQGVYEIIVENSNGTLKSEGVFNFVLICTPPTQAARILADCQPSLISIPNSVEVTPVWTVLVAFDHAIYTPFDVLLVEEDACEPIRSAFRESSRYATYDPMKDMQTLHKPIKQSILHPDPPKGPIWGGKTHSRQHRNAPSMTSYGSAVDAWVIHATPGWSRDNRHEVATEVAQTVIKAFLRMLGLSSAPLRLLVSEAILWEHGHVAEPACVHAVKPNVDKAFGPYCVFDPVTGIGMAGDWFVEASVEGALVSGLEMATLAGRSPIMFNQGQANPYGHVQFEITKNLQQRMREGAEIISGYSSDSRASTAVGEDWDSLEWTSKVNLKNLRDTHVQTGRGAKDLIKKDVSCRFTGCTAWVAPQDVQFHRHHCPFRPSTRCVFAACAKYMDVKEIKHHTKTCAYGVYQDCGWCFQAIALPEVDSHKHTCLGKPKTLLRQKQLNPSAAHRDPYASDPVYSPKGTAPLVHGGAGVKGARVILPRIAGAAGSNHASSHPGASPAPHALPVVVEETERGHDSDADDVESAHT